jgi:hypothetical protein
MTIEYKDNIIDWMNRDEMYPMEDYRNDNGIAEFDIADYSKYEISAGKMPFLRFHSQTRAEEILPFPDEHTLDYSEIHWQLERWSLFQTLPNLMKFDKNAMTLLK